MDWVCKRNIQSQLPYKESVSAPNFLFCKPRRFSHFIQGARNIISPAHCVEDCCNNSLNKPSAYKALLYCFPVEKCCSLSKLLRDVQIGSNPPQFSKRNA